MIPLFAVLGVRWRNRQGFRLWIPLFIVWLLPLPLVLMLLPIAFVVLGAVRLNPFRAIATGWQIIVGLRGMHIEVNDGSTHVLVKVF